jgi:hypothetical protein
MWQAPEGERKANLIRFLIMKARLVSFVDVRDVRHTVEVSDDSLFEAAAGAVRVFRENGWLESKPGRRPASRSRSRSRSFGTS